MVAFGKALLRADSQPTCRRALLLIPRSARTISLQVCTAPIPRLLPQNTGEAVAIPCRASAFRVDEHCIDQVVVFFSEERAGARWGRRGVLYACSIWFSSAEFRFTLAPVAAVWRRSQRAALARRVDPVSNGSLHHRVQSFCQASFSGSDFIGPLDHLNRLCGSKAVWVRRSSDHILISALLSAFVHNLSNRGGCDLRPVQLDVVAAFSYDNVSCLSGEAG
jgi:hypothetical protein